GRCVRSPDREGLRSTGAGPASQPQGPASRLSGNTTEDQRKETEMKPARFRFLAGLSALIVSSILGGTAVAQEKMRVSLDTNPSHVRNKGVEIFIEELKKRIGDKLVV